MCWGNTFSTVPFMFADDYQRVSGMDFWNYKYTEFWIKHTGPKVQIHGWWLILAVNLTFFGMSPTQAVGTLVGVFLNQIIWSWMTLPKPGLHLLVSVQMKGPGRRKLLFACLPSLWPAGIKSDFFKIPRETDWKASACWEISRTPAPNSRDIQHPLQNWVLYLSVVR